MTWTGRINVIQGPELTQDQYDLVVRVANDHSFQKQQSGLTHWDQTVEAGGMIIRVMDYDYGLQEVRVITSGGREEELEERREEEEEFEEELTGITYQMETERPPELDLIALAKTDPPVGSEPLFDPRIYNADYLDLISASTYTVRPFRRAYPKGIFAGNVDWRDRERGLQISWKGDQSRFRAPTSSGGGRQIYQRGELLAEIPVANGHVYGAGLDADNVLNVIASNYRTTFVADERRLWHLQLVDGEWVATDEIRFDSNPGSITLFPVTAFFFNSNCTAATGYLYSGSGGRVVSRVDWTPSGFSQNFYQLPRGVSRMRVSAVGDPTSGSISGGFVEYSELQTYDWADITLSPAILTDYDGLEEKTLTVAYGDASFSASGSVSYSNNVENTGPSGWDVEEGTRTRVTSGAGSFTYTFLFGDPNSDDGFRLNGKAVSGLPLPTTAPYAGSFTCTGSAQSSSSAAWTLTNIPASNAWQADGGSNFVESAESEADVKTDLRPRLDDLFYADLRDEVFGWRGFTSLPLNYRESFTSSGAVSGARSGVYTYSFLPPEIDGSSTISHTTTLFGPESSITAEFAGESAEVSSTGSPGGPTSFSGSAGGVALLPNPGQSPFELQIDDFGGRWAPEGFGILAAVLGDTATIASYSQPDPTGGIYGSQTYNAGSIEHIDGDRIYAWSLAGGLVFAGQKWNDVNLTSRITPTPQKVSGTYDFRVF